jgi:hypothetical protein
MAKEKKEQKYYNGIAVDSQEEVMTIMYFEELMEAGYVFNIQRAGPISLSDRLENKYTEVVEMKTKTKTVQKNQILLEDHVYTPEFIISWTTKGCDLFTNVFTGFVPKKFEKPFISQGSSTWIEVKPNFDQNNMTRLFKINQKWMWQRHQIFVNLIQPHKLFQETFTPKAWLLTPTSKQRVIHWPVRTLEEYVNSLKNQ